MEWECISVEVQTDLMFGQKSTERKKNGARCHILDLRFTEAKNAMKNI